MLQPLVRMSNSSLEGYFAQKIRFLLPDKPYPQFGIAVNILLIKQRHKKILKSEFRLHFYCSK